jgi:hypothetical protein
MGTGDYNHDGKSDVLWQNSSGAVSVWEMNGTSLCAAAILANPVPPGTSDRARRSSIAASLFFTS